MGMGKPESQQGPRPTVPRLFRTSKVESPLLPPEIFHIPVTSHIPTSPDRFRRLSLLEKKHSACTGTRTFIALLDEHWIGLHAGRKESLVRPRVT